MKRNNHLLKPYTNYCINKDGGFIVIDGEKYKYEMDVNKLGLDPDGDTIRTENDVNFVSRFPLTALGAGYMVELKVRNKIPDYNKLLKDKKIYVINTECIIIGKSRYTYDISNKRSLGLDFMGGDIIKIHRMEDGSIGLTNCNQNRLVCGDQEETIDAKIIITGIYKKMSALDQARLETINGKNKSSAVIDLIKIKIDRVIQKILNSNAYKNGKLTVDFIALNPDMLHPRITSINISTKYSQSDIIYFTTHESVEHPLGMFDLYLYRYINFYIPKIFPSIISQNLLSSKHFVGIPPVWQGPGVISMLNNYEEYYKEIKYLYKITGLLERLREERK